MRRNEYTSLDTFIYEYANGKAFSWQDSNGIERYMGIEFLYNDHYYRLCREPEDCVPKNSKGRFHVMEMKLLNNHYPELDDYLEIGWYESLNDVLKNCMIQNTAFEKVIMADDTVILSKD